MTYTTLVIPDLQIPLHDTEFVEKLIDVAGYVKPDALAFAGDLTDSTEVGQWVRGRAGEYAGRLKESFDMTSKIVKAFRAAVGEDCEMSLVRSNHDERMEKYIDDNAPALKGLVNFEEAAGLNQSRVDLRTGPFLVSPLTVLVHGHERTSSSVQGKWGLDRVHEYGMNVVYGHTHTPHVVTTAIGVKSTGQRHSRWAMNVGHGMDMVKASYLTDGYATWNQAFGLVNYDPDFNITTPELVMAINGHFSLEGRFW